MTLSVKHFFDSQETNLSVCIDAYIRNDIHSYQYKTATEENDSASKKVFLNSVGIKLDGRVSVFDSEAFHQAYSGIASSKNKSQIMSSFEKMPYPICVRYKSDNCVVIERPPFKVSPTVRYGRRSWRKNVEYQKESEMWIPWTILVLVNKEEFRFNKNIRSVDSLLFFRDAPLTSFDDRICLPYTPNIHHNGKICFGETEKELYDKLNSELFSETTELYSFIINQYFSGGWNTDLNISGLQRNKKEYINNKMLPSLRTLAERAQNKYILSLLKKYGSDFEESFDEESFYYDMDDKQLLRFFMNYFSCLTLEESLKFTSFMLSIGGDGYNQYTNSKSYSFTIGDVLAAYDEDFYNLNKVKYKRKNIYTDFSTNYNTDHLLRYCRANNNDKTPLHTISLLLSFNVDDFLDFCSEQILNDYFDRNYWLFNGFSREDFYKKNIKYNLHKLPDLFKRLSVNYFVKLEQHKNYSELLSKIDETFKELSSFYVTSDGLNASKKFLTINLNDIKLVINKELLFKEVVV